VRKLTEPTAASLASSSSARLANFGASGGSLWDSNWALVLGLISYDSPQCWPYLMIRLAVWLISTFVRFVLLSPGHLRTVDCLIFTVNPSTVTSFTYPASGHSPAVSRTHRRIILHSLTVGPQSQSKFAVLLYLFGKGTNTY
jgi:hypothetical protein